MDKVGLHSDDVRFGAVTAETHQAGSVHGHDDRLLLLSGEQLQEGGGRPLLRDSKSKQHAAPTGASGCSTTYDVPGVDAQAAE